MLEGGHLHALAARLEALDVGLQVRAAHVVEDRQRVREHRAERVVEPGVLALRGAAELRRDRDGTQLVDRLLRQLEEHAVRRLHEALREPRRIEDVAERELHARDVERAADDEPRAVLLHVERARGVAPRRERSVALPILISIARPSGL